MRDTWTDPVVEQEVAEATAKRNAEHDEFAALCIQTRPALGDAWCRALFETSEVIAGRLDESETFWRGWIIGRLASGLSPPQVIQEGMAMIEARESLVRPR